VGIAHRLPPSVCIDWWAMPTLQNHQHKNRDFRRGVIYHAQSNRANHPTV
jgi:hypothetical protein